MKNNCYIEVSYKNIYYNSNQINQFFTRHIIFTSLGYRNFVDPHLQLLSSVLYKSFWRINILCKLLKLFLCSKILPKSINFKLTKWTTNMVFPKDKI